MSFLDGFLQSLSDVNAIRQKCHKCQKSENEGENGIFGNIGNIGPTSQNQNEPDPAALPPARRMLVLCPVQQKKLHCWYCSRCDDARTCSAWRTHRADVEFFRQSEKSYSLSLVEGAQEDQKQAGTVPDYAAFCLCWWRGCFKCPDFMVAELRFCAKYNRMHDATEVLQ